MNLLRLLIVTEAAEDAEPIAGQIRKAGINCEFQQTFPEQGPLMETRSFSPDIVLADGKVNRSSLIRNMKNSGISSPLILVTGVPDGELLMHCIEEESMDSVYESSLEHLPAALLDVIRRRKIQEEKAALMRSLQASEERYSLAAHGSKDGIWDWNLDSHEIYYSDRWKEMLGFTGGEIQPDISEWLARVHSDDSIRVRAMIDAHLEGRMPHLECEYRMMSKDGSWHWMLTRGLAVRESTGRAYRIAGTQTDITERKKFEEQLLHNTLHDPLTGLANRVLLMDRIGRSMERARRRAKYAFAVLFLDLDRFKLINDSLGHTIGDQLLAGIARRLEKIVRPADTVCRLGGDEFVVLADDMADEKDAHLVAARIEKALLLPFDLSGMQLYVSSSIGIAPSSGHEKPEDLVRHADTAMYRAKAQGRARVVVYDPSMHGRAASVLQMEQDLHHALERQEFRMFYQPIVTLQNGKIAAFEALVRWQHPENGILTPPEFIPVAEESGLMVPLGNWIIEECCRQGKIFQDRFGGGSDFGISVNISPAQLSHPDLIPFLVRTLQASGLPPEFLRFEITENMILEDPDTTVQMLLRLRALKVKLHLDDFGTGHSSLGYIHRFPIDSLKIDRSLIRTMDQDNESLEIVKTVILLGRNLHKKVIAEGVETEDQMQRLREWRCDQAQGYYFSRPLEFEAAGASLGSSAFR